MNEIKLDPKKLLGFKIIADNEKRAVLRSPKIGTKGCATVAGEDLLAGGQLAVRAKA